MKPVYFCFVLVVGVVLAQLTASGGNGEGFYSENPIMECGHELVDKELEYFYEDATDDTTPEEVLDAISEWISGHNGLWDLETRFENSPLTSEPGGPTGPSGTPSTPPNSPLPPGLPPVISGGVFE